MTIVENPVVAVPSPVQWTRVTHDLWAAADDDGFVGTVEQVDGVYLSFDDHSVQIGEHPDLEDAKHSVLNPAGRGYHRRRAAGLKQRTDEARLARITAVVAVLSFAGVVAFIAWAATL